ncbi:MAG: LysM peptidoglycan-binding domain-containing protein, partial [Prochlorococcaceae cyanobacterium]
MRRRPQASASALALALLLTAGATAQAQPRSITVVAGDTLEQLALRYGVSLQALIDANGITDPTLLQVGQVLKLPGRAPAAAAESAPPPPDGLSGEAAAA